MIKLPLRLTITSAFTLFMVLIVSAVAIVNYIGNRDAIFETAKTNIAKSATTAEQEIELLLSRAFNAADTIAGLPKDLFSWQTPEALLGTLTVSLKTSPEIYGVFVGFPDGAFVQAINLTAPNGDRRAVPGMPADAVTAWRVIRPAIVADERTETWRFFNSDRVQIADPASVATKATSYDPRTRPWFIDAQKAAQPVISPAYVFASLKKPGVTVAQPLYNFSEATVGVDLSLNDLAGLTYRVQPGKNGVVAILDAEHRVIGYPQPEKIVSNDGNGVNVDLVSASEIDDPRIRKAIELGASASASHIDFQIGGQQYLGYISRHAEDSLAKWNIVSVAAIGDFTGTLMETLNRSLLIAAIVLVIAVAGVSVMAGWISSPVIGLRGMADQITNLNLGDIKGFDSPFEEINRLQMSMDSMRGALDMFLRFVPRDVVRELIKSEKAVTVGGTRREVTLLFTDIASFTTLAERMTPEQIMSQTSEYFEVMSLGIQANRGTIDKFIGDAIMAIWNAPSEDPFHVDNACRGMLASYYISKDLNEEFIAKGMAPLKTRFGLHTCEVLVGNVGARDRMQYTCLGSGVNLAARIEGLNKFYGTQLLASDTVRRNASSDFLFRRVDIVEAKGTTVPLTIYELMGERGEDAAFYVGADMIKLASKYEQAFDFYLHRDFADALFILDQLAGQYPDDAVVAQLRAKCRSFAETPPPPSWNGATVLDEK
ncbi:adenylate/guanylate cyclase domain-containing protein [Thalassospiraceae bacterium LMO-JJ14]|nr:adenylate/guanylate cyclase domain-containing protein [Thalassospiraceae bacterium LMO-JJ14]